MAIKIAKNDYTSHRLNHLAYAFCYNFQITSIANCKKFSLHNVGMKKLLSTSQTKQSTKNNIKICYGKSLELLKRSMKNLNDLLIGFFL